MTSDILQSAIVALCLYLTWSLQGAWDEIEKLKDFISASIEEPDEGLYDCTYCGRNHTVGKGCPDRFHRGKCP